MAKSKIKEWTTPEKLIQLRGWKMDGLSDKQIASNIGITRRTLESWKSKNLHIFHMLRVGKTIANYSVENALFKKAMRGNTACIIFWLKNNFSRKYSDTQDSFAESKLKHAQIRKIRAEAKLVENKAQTMGNSNKHVSTQADKILSLIFDDKRSKSDKKGNK